MFNSVIAFGDSHVAGCELSGSDILTKYQNGEISLEDGDTITKELSFPNLLAALLNIPCYNYALSGGSNARSLRLLTKVLQTHTNSLILFGYTYTDRAEFYYPDDGQFIGRDADNFIQVGMQWDGIATSIFSNSKLKHPINNAYLKILRPYNNLNDLIFTVNTLCTATGNTVLHLLLFPENIHNPLLFDFNGINNYIGWCKINKFNQLPLLHFDKIAHEELAKLILQSLVDRKS